MKRPIALITGLAAYLTVWVWLYAMVFVIPITTSIWIEGVGSGVMAVFIAVYVVSKKQPAYFRFKRN
jgi:hypothetical protein